MINHNYAKVVGHRGILGFMTLFSVENKNIPVFDHQLRTKSPHPNSFWQLEAEICVWTLPYTMKFGNWAYVSKLVKPNCQRICFEIVPIRSGLMLMLMLMRSLLKPENDSQSQLGHTQYQLLKLFTIKSSKHSRSIGVLCWPVTNYL